MVMIMPIEIKNKSYKLDIFEQNYWFVYLLFEQQNIVFEYFN